MICKFRIKKPLGIVAFLFLISCQEQGKVSEESTSNEVVDSARWVISNSIKHYGGDFQEKIIEFDFREKHYKANFNSNENSMTRSYSRNDSIFVDSTNGSLAISRINNTEINHNAKKSQSITNAINSVFYFALLPSKLADPAVVANYKGKVKMNSRTYYQVAVQFNQEGGGEDFQDKFFYWFNSETMDLSFLAYSYETNNGGIRFRSIEQQHKLENGYIFQDYINYKTDSLTISLEQLLPMFMDSSLTELSRIRVENVIVRPSM